MGRRCSASVVVGDAVVTAPNGYQDINPGKPGKDADMRLLNPNQPDAGVAFDISIEQRIRPGLLGKLRIETRPWS